MSTETKFCHQCTETKSLTKDFYFYKKKNTYAPVCKSCISVNTKKWQRKLSDSTNLNDIQNLTLYKIIQSSCSSAKARNMPFEISISSVRELYAKQQGKCYYTGTPMTLRSKGHINRDPFLISLDRIDSAQGYTLANTVLCCFGVNVLKGHHPETTLYSTLRTLYENCHTLGKC